MKEPWEFDHRGKVPVHSAEELWANKRFSGLANEETGGFFTNDKDNPYIEKRPFDWIRAYHTGGKSMHWGRQSYRWNKQDFEANAKDGHGVDWPIRYEELESWYTYVEKFVGVSGQKEGLDVLPDGHFLPAMPMFPPELAESWLSCCSIGSPGMARGIKKLMVIARNATSKVMPSRCEK